MEQIKSFKKKLRYRLIKHYLSGRFSQKDAYLLTSSPRSGSTLLGQVLGAIPDACTLFEPLHLENVPESKAAGFSWRTYMPREKDWPEGEKFLKRVFEGRIVNEWTAREITFQQAFKSQRLVVKFVRANRLLPWICNKFAIPSPILLLRHPCAVISSQLNYGWKNANRPDIPLFLKEYPRFQTALSETEGDVEFLAALWALDQLPALMEQGVHPWTTITYEELILHPERTLLKISEKWNIKIDTKYALSMLKKPSSVVSSSGISGINGWKEIMSEDQIYRIIKTVNSFGLSFYSENNEAEYSKLYSEDLAKCIQTAGTGNSA